MQAALAFFLLCVRICSHVAKAWVLGLREDIPSIGLDAVALWLGHVSGAAGSHVWCDVAGCLGEQGSLLLADCTCASLSWWAEDGELSESYSAGLLEANFGSSSLKGRSWNFSFSYFRSQSLFV